MLGASETPFTLVGPNRRTVLVGLGAGLTALALPGYSIAAGPKQLRYGLSAYPPTRKPWENTGSASGVLCITMHRGLMGYDGNAKLVPEVAESVEWPNETTAVFRIRSNAVFHNGEPVTAKDVIFSLQSIRAPDSTAFLKTSFDDIANVEALDEKTVKFTLHAPSAVFTQLLAARCYASVIWAGSPADEPVGCGPYRLKSEERGTFVEVERFPDFYEMGRPVSDSIRFISYPDENLRYAALQTGDVDLIEYLPWAQFDAVSNSDSLKMAPSTGAFMLILFNVAKGGPFANPKVRQAIGYAVKREDVIEAAFAGYGKPLYGFPNPDGSLFDLSDPASQWNYDPERAKQLLSEAGYSNGFDCRLLTTSTYVMHQDTASIVQAYLQMIGINATLDLRDWASRVKAGTDGDFDIAVHGLSGFYNDPDALWPLLHSGEASYTRSFGFVSKEIDSLLEKGRNTINTRGREMIYRKLAKAYFEEVPQVPLNWRVGADALAMRVTGYMGFPGWLNGASAYSLDEADPR